MSTTTYSAWVSDSEGNRLYTTSGHATRQEALDQAWKRYPGARSVASARGANGWEDVQFQTAVARRIEKGEPEPTGDAWEEPATETTARAFDADPHAWTDENGMRYRCKRCHEPMLSILPTELTSGVCRCGGLIEADPRNFADIDPALYGLPQDSEIGAEVYPINEPTLDHPVCFPVGSYRVWARTAAHAAKILKEYLAEDIRTPAGWDVAEPGPEQAPPTPFRYVSVRQQAAEEAFRAGRKPCREVAHGAGCPGDCDPKVGDRVICTDDSASFNRLRRGDTYTVEANFDGSPTVIVNGCSHSIERFRTEREARP